MSKHSLISTVAGLGLMAASMGVSAQSSMTFDYSMMFYGNATGGGKYIAFVPTSARSNDGAPTPAETPGALAVLMLDLFQPATGSASTWAYALGGPVDSVAGGSLAPAAALDAGFGSVYLHGSNNSIEMSFAQAVVVSSQACNVTFNAQVDTNNQLRFADVVARVGRSDGAYLKATGDVSYSSGAAPGVGAIVKASDWNNGSAAVPALAGAGAKIEAGNLVWVTGSGVNDTVALDAAGSAAAIGAFTARNKCVAAYTARAQGGATVIGPGGAITLGMTRVW